LGLSVVIEDLGAAVLVVAEGVADLLIAAEAGNAPTASMAPAAIAGMMSFRVSFTARPLLVLFVSSLILLITAGERPGGNSQLPKRKSLESMSTDPVPYLSGCAETPGSPGSTV
jgi:hypothetical protein